MIGHWAQSQQSNWQAEIAMMLGPLCNGSVSPLSNGESKGVI